MAAAKEAGGVSYYLQRTTVMASLCRMMNVVFGSDGWDSIHQ